MAEPIRYAVVRDDNIDRVSRYLPENYKVIRRVPEGLLIQGRDHHGWTMDKYVIPRLASGLIFAEEVDDPRFNDPANDGALDVQMEG